MIALATVLSMIKFANLPFGGSVTLCSMLPLVLIAYRYKWKWGLLTGVVYGLVQMVLGANNLSYGTSALAVWKMWAPEGQPAWLYSVTYNATYMVPETIVTIVVGVLIALVLDFRKDTVGALKRA